MNRNFDPGIKCSNEILNIIGIQSFKLTVNFVIFRKIQMENWFKF